MLEGEHSEAGVTKFSRSRGVFPASPSLRGLCLPLWSCSLAPPTPNQVCGQRTVWPACAQFTDEKRLQNSPDSLSSLLFTTFSERLRAQIGVCLRGRGLYSFTSSSPFLSLALYVGSAASWGPAPPGCKGPQEAVQGGRSFSGECSDLIKGPRDSPGRQRDRMRQEGQGH